MPTIDVKGATSGIKDSRTLLGPLFQKILDEHHITEPMLQHMLKEYQFKLHTEGRLFKNWNFAQDIRMQLKGEEVTWKIFCMGLEAIGVDSVALSALVTFKEVENG